MGVDNLNVIFNKSGTALSRTALQHNEATPVRHDKIMMYMILYELMHYLGAVAQRGTTCPAIFIDRHGHVPHESVQCSAFRK